MGLWANSVVVVTVCAGDVQEMEEEVRLRVNALGVHSRGGVCRGVR